MNLFIEIDSSSNLPLYKQVANAIKDSIDSGRLQEGKAVPSTRQLSVHLGVSRITVVQSYEQLVSQGYLKVITGTGTFVSRREKTQLPTSPTKANINHFSKRSLSQYGTRLIAGENQQNQAETAFGLPPTQLLPLRQWQKLLAKYCSSPEMLPLVAHEPLGCRPLREALAQYLRRSRNLNCSAETIAVFANAQQAVSLITQLLIDSGDTVAVENPGFIGAHKTIRSIGAEALAINVDENGLIVSELRANPTACRAAYVTPSHQDPLGVTLSLQRRQELLTWAVENNSYIIEDDYGCEYRYGQPSLQAIQSLDRHESVVYISSFWKLLYPIMPIGFIAAPPHLVPAITQAKQLAELSFSLPEQLALAELLNEGHLEKHINKTQKQLAKWRQELIMALTLAFGKDIAIARYSSGMHIAAQFHLALSDDIISSAADEAGLSVISTKSYYLAEGKRGEFLISFASQKNQNLTELVRQFAARIKAR